MPRILIVEDNRVNQEFLRLALAGRGELTMAGSGEEGLEAFQAALGRSQPFDLVFLDIVLPGMDGLQALERMRAAEDALGLPEAHCAQVIITTSLDDNRKASRAFIHGRAVSYMTKPFRPRDIAEELRKLGFGDGAVAKGDAEGQG